MSAVGAPVASRFVIQEDRAASDQPRDICTAAAATALITSLSRHPPFARPHRRRGTAVIVGITTTPSAQSSSAPLVVMAVFQAEIEGVVRSSVHCGSDDIIIAWGRRVLLRHRCRGLLAGGLLGRAVAVIMTLGLLPLRVMSAAAVVVVVMVGRPVTGPPIMILGMMPMEVRMYMLVVLPVILLMFVYRILLLLPTLLAVRPATPPFAMRVRTFHPLCHRRQMVLAALLTTKRIMMA